MNFLIKLIIFLYLFIHHNAYSFENKIIFEIEGKFFTSIDIKFRKEYLQQTNQTKDIKEEDIIKDFISVNLFNEYFLKNIKNKDINNEALNIYNNLKISDDLQLLLQENNFRDNFIKNIKLDLIRRNIIQDILNSKRSEIFKEINEINLLYNFDIDYVNLNNSDFLKLQNRYNLLDISNIDNLIELLQKENIEFIIKRNNIKNIENIKNIHNINFSKKEIIVKEYNDYTSIIFTKKKFETYEGVIATLVNIQTNQSLNNNDLSCQNIQNSENKNYNIKSYKYEYSKLNDKIKNNLISKNDYIIINTDDFINYIVLCELNFDEEILNNINLNKKINSLAQEIENNFIVKYSKLYNLNVAQ